MVHHLPTEVSESVARQVAARIPGARLRVETLDTPEWETVSLYDVEKMFASVGWRRGSERNIEQTVYQLTKSVERYLDAEAGETTYVAPNGRTYTSKRSKFSAEQSMKSLHDELGLRMKMGRGKRSKNEMLWDEANEMLMTSGSLK